MKLQTVKYVFERGKSAKKLAKELGIFTNTVRRCVRESPYDNSCVEILFATCKKELTFRRKNATIEEVKTESFRYTSNRKIVRKDKA